MKKTPLLFLFSFIAFCNFAQNIIPIHLNKVINLSTRDTATKLFNEQVLSGDPKNGSGGEPTSIWRPGYTTWHYPAEVVVDLGAEYHLTDIYLFDNNGSGNISFYAGTPFQWDSIATNPQSRYLQWSGMEVDIVTQYVKITVWSTNIVPSEILFYGTLETEIADTAWVKEHPKPLMKDFIGTNAFIDDPVDLIAAGGFLREYHNWSFSEVDTNVFEFSRWNGFWDFDSYYDTLKKLGVLVAPCLQGSVNFHKTEGRIKPLFNGENPTNPLSYSEHAQLMYQFAARYGKTEVPFENLLLNEGQVFRSGMNLVKYYENWNEQDAWWEGREGWFSPFEYAAMSSADIDGHLGALGANYGLKTADKSAKMVMGGTALLDLEYVKGIMFWSKFNRNGDFPADVLNFHHYSNDHGGQGSSQVGICPEADSLKERIQKLVDFRNLNLHDKELWITEFGYDINASSVQRAPAYTDFTAYDVQAMWLIRSYLAIAAAGADKAAMYMLRDVDPAGTTKYNSSGLVTQKGEWNKKPSWYYVATLKNQLGNYRFSREIESGNENVWIYEFRNASTNEPAYVLWCPTQNGTEVANYTLNFDETYETVHTIQFGSNTTYGDTIQTNPDALSIQVTVSEEPVIVKTESYGRTAQTIQLTKGWNLISFNALSIDMSVESAFNSVIHNVRTIKNFDSFYNSAFSSHLNSLNNIEIGKGYFVYMNSPCTLFLEGFEVNPTEYPSELFAGWNLVGSPFYSARPIENEVAEISVQLNTVKDLDNFFQSGNSESQLTNFTPGKGYFILVNDDCTLQWE